MRALDFFKDDRGGIHGGRIAGVIYIVSAAQGVVSSYVQHSFMARQWLPRIAFTLGWWLAFSDKRSPRSFVDLVAWPRHAIGVALMVIWLVASFYSMAG